ncbi:hypothetical protein [Pseudobacillus badius]|uniref:hypothetical protein n=1 Tax=Bacillus badius TaxID=1455 RepID=UPI003D33BFBE
MREDHHSFEEEIIIEEGGEKYNNSPFEQSQHEAERGGDEEDFIEGQNRSLENKRSSNQPNNKNKLQNTIARQGKKAGRALVKKGAQKLKKLAVKAVVKLGALAIKALGALIAWVGLPMVLLFGFLIVVTVVGMMISTSIVGTGEAAEEFGAEAQALNEYVKELSQSTIDQSKPEQFVYRVPEELLAAVVQMDSLTKDFEEKGKADPLHDYKKILKIFADKLKPQFEYETYTEVTETRTRSCDENGENCSWSTSKTTRKVTQLVGVTAWNGNMSADYEKQTTGWSGGNPQTKETYYVQKNYQHQYDYSMLDAILNSQGYNEEDKKIFEMLYEYATGTPMYYIAWLNGHDISFEDGCYSIDGNIIPGAGVPPQFMPHYLSASQKYGVPWEYLAAIHRVETTFSTDLNTSYAGAVGHTQVRP